MDQCNFSAMTLSRPLRIGFFGLPLAALLLQSDGHSLEWAVLSPLPMPGRRRLTQRLPSARLLDLFLDDSSWQTEFQNRLATVPVDLIVSWFFTRRILGSWIELAPLGALGVHPSLLPRHRGPDPFFAAIDAGDLETGVTAHRLTEEYDRGAILGQRRLAIGGRNAWQLARALDRPSLGLLREVVAGFAQGRPPQATDQNESEVTWAAAPEGDALRVDWSWTTERVLRRIRALGPTPGLALELNGTRFSVLAAAAEQNFPTALLPGEAQIGRRLVLRTGNGAIAVEMAEVEREDEEPMVLGGARLADLLREQEKLTQIVEF